MSELLTKYGGLMVLAAMLSAGCTASQYAKRADRSAYGALAMGQAVALGQSEPFDVEYRPFCADQVDSDCVIRIGKKLVRTGDVEPVALTLDECLEVALRNSRSFQNEKEVLYSEALALANARRSWDVPLLQGELDGDIEHTSINKVSETKAASASVGPSIQQRFVHGGVLTLAATLEWATDFISGSSDENVVGSLLEANITQPLLRGAWRGLAYEDQYRLERDFLFAVFDYHRFRQTFIANIFTRYYSVLQQRDQLENDRISIGQQKRTFELTKVQVEGGQVSRVEQDRAEQAMLQAQVRFERRQQNYQDGLDSFKLLLGLPIEASIELDYPDALRSLSDVGPKDVGFGEIEAIDMAFAARPDVLVERAKLRDSERDVEIAADDFLPQLDLEMGISAAGREPRGFWDPKFNRNERFVKMTFNYNLDQTDNRDNYRLAMIDYEKAGRDLAEFLDDVRLEVRSAYRELVQSKRSFELQDKNVRIANRRYRLASLRQKEGQLSATDVLDAEQDLRLAKNDLTSALVSYTTTRLEFLTTLGMIDVDEKGKLHERTEPFKFGRISRRYEYVDTR